MNDTNSELIRRRLHNADPAKGLPGLRDDEISRLAAQALDSAPVTAKTRATTTSGRVRRIWLAGGAGLAAIGAAAVAIPLAISSALIASE